MPSRRLQRGATLIEAMVAMAVLMIGAAGLAALNRQSNLFIADSRQATRAATFAQDLATQIELWDFADPRLDNTNTGNDANPAADFEKTVPDQAPDHGEADLTLGGATWAGLPGDLLTANGMERYWNVSTGDNANGNALPDAKRIAVIVRWRPADTGSWRKAVFFVVKRNEADFL